MDLSGASAQLRRMDGECRCPLEMLRCVNEADRCLTESVSRLRCVDSVPKLPPTHTDSVDPRVKESATQAIGFPCSVSVKSAFSHCVAIVI